jgi:hypothetical protein
VSAVLFDDRYYLYTKASNQEGEQGHVNMVRSLSAIIGRYIERQRIAQDVFLYLITPAGTWYHALAHTSIGYNCYAPIITRSWWRNDERIAPNIHRDILCAHPASSVPKVNIKNITLIPCIYIHCWCSRSIYNSMTWCVSYIYMIHGRKEIEPAAADPMIRWWCTFCSRESPVYKI